MAKKYRAARVGEEKISGTMKIYSLPHQKSNGPPLTVIVVLVAHVGEKKRLLKLVKKKKFRVLKPWIGVSTVLYTSIISVIFDDQIKAKKIPWKIRLCNAKYEWSWQWCRGNS